MLIYHPDCELKLSEYGILIPVADDRSFKVFQSLKEIHPKLEISNYPNIIMDQDLKLAHDELFINNLKKEDILHKELEVCFELYDEFGVANRYDKNRAVKNISELYQAILKQVNYSYHSSLIALEKGFSYFLGGGFHHAMTFGGRGFCFINDIAIVAKKLILEKKVQSVWVIDVDVHKGDGTAEILKDVEKVKTLSIHMKNGWPLNMGTKNSPWFTPSTIDIELEQNKEDEYLSKLKWGIDKLFSEHKRPDLVIIVNGSDPYELDELESSNQINLTKKEMLERDLYLYQTFKEKMIPQSYLMAGGYGKSSWEIYFQFLNEIIIREGESFFQV